MVQLSLKRDIEPATPAWPLQGIGTLTEWNDERGFGFITPEAGGPKVFLHVKSLIKEARRPVVGELFFYKLATDERGRPRAEEAFQTIFSEKRNLPAGHSFLRGLSQCCLLGIIVPFAVAVWQSSIVWGIIASLLFNSALTVAFYREDKYLAQYKYWRIPERSLHLWALIGGWPGALYAQRKYRHKRQKQSFQVVFYLCVIANCAAMGYVTTRIGVKQADAIIQEFRQTLPREIFLTIRTSSDK